MGEQARSTEMAGLLEALRKEYRNGLVASWEPRAVKAGKGLARYLIKYVASPPRAVSRIVAYDGQEVEYFWQDHQSHPQERARVSAVEFIRRLVQHRLPKGFQRVRYLGLHAVCLRKKMMERVRKAIGATIQMAFYFGEAVLQKLGWRAKIKSKFERDPMRCEKRGEEIILWKVWAPTHGVLYYLPDDAPKWVESRTSSRDVVQAQLRFSF